MATAYKLRGTIAAAPALAAMGPGFEMSDIQDMVSLMTKVKAGATIAVSLVLALGLGSSAPVLAQSPLSGPPSSTSTVAPPWQNPDLAPQAAPQAPPPAAPPPVATNAPPPPPPLGSVSPIRAPGRPECREFQQTIMIGGQPQRAYGTACHQPDGTWKIVH